MIQFTNEFLLIFVFGLLKEILFYLVEVTKTPRTQNLIESFKLSRYLIFSYMEFFYMNILPVIAFFFSKPLLSFYALESIHLFKNTDEITEKGFYPN